MYMMIPSPEKLGDASDLRATARTDVALRLGLLVAAGLVGCLVAYGMPAKKTYTPNRSRSRSRARLPETCRSGPPKHYPKDRRKYALPECWMYPVHDRPHVRKAAQRFGKHKARYSVAIRKKIAKRIDQAKRRFGIGEYRIR